MPLPSRKNSLATWKEEAMDQNHSRPSSLLCSICCNNQNQNQNQKEKEKEKEKEKGGEEQPLLHCHQCQQGFHLPCLNLNLTSSTPAPNPWLCPLCMHHQVEKRVSSDLKCFFQNLPVPNTSEFEIPKSLHDFAKKLNKRNPPFIQIRRNIHLSKRPKKQLDDCMQCSCKPIAGQKVCGRDCFCGMLQTSCSSLCGCGDLCQNLPFQKRTGRRLELVKTDKCGLGVVAVEDIKAGDFIIEYVGEVIDDKECENRLWTMKESGEANFYMCEITREVVIDATFKGNISRYINHSCCPNCELQKWQIDGELRIGIFAISDIRKGEAVNYDYQFIQFGTDQKCYCGAKGCRGTLGAKPLSKQKQSADAAYDFVTKELEKSAKKARHCNNTRQECRVTTIDQYFRQTKTRHDSEGTLKGFLKEEKNGAHCIGRRVRVWWPLDSKFYSATVVEYNPFSQRHKVVYDDGEIEHLLMNEERWEFEELAPVKKVIDG